MPPVVPQSASPVQARVHTPPSTLVRQVRPVRHTSPAPGSQGAPMFRATGAVSTGATSSGGTTSSGGATSSGGGASRGSTASGCGATSTGASSTGAASSLGVGPDVALPQADASTIAQMQSGRRRAHELPMGVVSIAPAATRQASCGVRSTRRMLREGASRGSTEVCSKGGAVDSPLGFPSGCERVGEHKGRSRVPPPTYELSRRAVASTQPLRSNSLGGWSRVPPRRTNSLRGRSRVPPSTYQLSRRVVASTPLARSR